MRKATRSLVTYWFSKIWTLSLIQSQCREIFCYQIFQMCEWDKCRALKWGFFEIFSALGKKVGHISILVNRLPVTPLYTIMCLPDSHSFVFVPLDSSHLTSNCFLDKSAGPSKHSKSSVGFQKINLTSKLGYKFGRFAECF